MPYVGLRTYRRAARSLRKRVALSCGALSFVALALAPPAHAQSNAKLPVLTPCQQQARPELPDAWRAVGVMMPFTDSQLDVGEFVYDEAAGAMRATVYGVESGAVDLLITESDTYLLSGRHDAPSSCTSLGDKFSLPPHHWMREKSVCLGEGRLAGLPGQSWKAAGADNVKANWHWLKRGSRVPYRSVFTSPSPRHPVIGDYAMTYFPSFAEAADTGLAALRQMCAGEARPASAPLASAARTARDLMAMRNAEAESERLARIEALVPGLSHRACAQAKPVRWPDRFVTTAMLTPISFAQNPYASLILYDWSSAQSQFAVMFQGAPPALQGLVALRRGIGYRLKNHAGGPHCEAVFPGIVRPDWMTKAGCRCRAVIDHNPALSPDDAVQVLSCPIKWQQRRVMWNWYTQAGEPISFFEAGASGGGVMLADYAQWLPHATVPAKNFDLPKVCFDDEAARRAVAHGGVTFSDPSCSDCHTTQ